MPAHQRSKEYVAKAKDPSATARANFEEAVQQFLQTLDPVSDEAVQQSRALQSAEIAEQDDRVRVLFEEAAQKHGAIIRLAQETRTLVRNLVNARRELAAVNERIDAAVKASAETPT